MNIPDTWSFSYESVAQDFDNHVKSELPWYGLATWMVTTLGSHFIPKHGLIYDIGASTGNIGRALKDVISNRQAVLVAIESELSMQRHYNGGGSFVLTDALDFDYQCFDFGVAFLSIMFMPINKRKDFLLKLFDKLNSGGCLVIFEKFEPIGGFLSTAIYRMTLDAKLKAGVDSDKIIKKELSLGGVQRPLSLGELPNGGIEIFRFGDFAGYVFLKKNDTISSI